MCVVSLLLPQIITPSLAQTAAPPVGRLTVTQAWSRPTPPAATVGAVYFSINNLGSKADLLLAVSSPIAARVELHESRNVRGVLEMRELTSVPCPAGASVVSEPGGLHVMLIGLNRPLIAGTAFALSLRFRDAGTLTLQIPVLTRE
jgi:copper(I)-binding protein